MRSDTVSLGVAIIETRGGDKNDDSRAKFCSGLALSLQQ